MLDIIIPIITFLVGGLAGGVIVAVVFKNKMKDVLFDENQISNMARSMGVNLNQKQLNKMKKTMQNNKNKKPKKK